MAKAINTDRAMDRAAVEAGYMTLCEYIKKWGNT